MQLKKSPKSLSTNDLLKLLDEYEEDISVKTKSERVLPIFEGSTSDEQVFNFLSQFEVKEGDYSVSSRKLYFIYRTWALEPCSQRKFLYSLKGHFVSEVISNVHWFKLNKSFNDLLADSKPYVERKKQSKFRSPYIQKQYEKFMKAHDIKAGKKYAINAMILYFFYDKWTYKNRLKQWLTYPLFIKFSELYFKVKFISPKPLLMTAVIEIDEAFFNKVSKEDIETAIQWSRIRDEKRHNKSKKNKSFEQFKKTKKKRGKLSRLKRRVQLKNTL